MHEYCTIAASYTKELQNQTGKRGSEGKEARDRECTGKKLPLTCSILFIFYRYIH